MAFPFPLWIVAASVLLAFGVWVLYERYLHPAWRRQRRVVRACERAFEEGDYKLERFRVSLDDPSIEDLFSVSPFGSEAPSRYFTYKIWTIEGAEPDFSGMSPRDIGLVRHYLRRNVDVPHHGKEVLSPRADERIVNNHSKVQA